MTSSVVLYIQVMCLYCDEMMSCRILQYVMSFNCKNTILWSYGHDLIIESNKKQTNKTKHDVYEILTCNITGIFGLILPNP